MVQFYSVVSRSRESCIELAREQQHRPSLVWCASSWYRYTEYSVLTLALMSSSTKRPPDSATASPLCTMWSSMCTTIYTAAHHDTAAHTRYYKQHALPDSATASPLCTMCGRASSVGFATPNSTSPYLTLPLHHPCAPCGRPCAPP
jgi:hypothetical protein